MMLEEIAGMFLSLFSLFMSERPRVSFREEIRQMSDTEEGSSGADKWLPYIHKEYDDNLFRNQELHSLLRDRRSRANKWLCSLGRGLNRSSMWKSLRTTLGMTLAMLSVSAIAIAFLYLDLYTTDVCIGWQYSTLSLSAKRLRVIGESVKGVITSLWFPLTIVVLFGWEKFKRKFLCTFYISLIFGEAIVIYYLFLLAYGLYSRHVYYGYPANVLYLVGTICCCIAAFRKIRTSCHPVAYSNIHIFALISTVFLVSYFMALTYRNVIISYFNSIKQRNKKFLAAALAPALTFIPAVICNHIALRRSSEIIHPGRSFVLVYVFRGVGVFLFRIMQADFKNIWLFIGLSLLSGVLKVLKKATYRIRMSLWRKFISLLKRTACCRRLEVISCNKPHDRRLKADLDIQDTLFDLGTLVLSQGYYLLYHVQNFDVAISSFVYDSLKKLAIAVGIDFVFNCLSNFVEIRCYNIPISRVWKKYWRRHLLANNILVIVVVSYFSPVLLSVFQASETTDGQYEVRNCTIL